ncbi:hypothetical protein GF325_05700 [Candidatus Bathyarchaeota archaeon]|nr:hypothetical protein [Candidatus Bathyarchaeota archaeon]
MNDNTNDTSQDDPGMDETACNCKEMHLSNDDREDADLDELLDNWEYLRDKPFCCK